MASVGTVFAHASKFSLNRCAGIASTTSWLLLRAKSGVSIGSTCGENTISEWYLWFERVDLIDDITSKSLPQI
jgi:hypothetical protein